MSLNSIKLKLPSGSRREVIAMAATSGTSVLAAAVAFIVNILMARELGPGARGQVAWVLQSAYVVAPLIALGVNREALRGSDEKQNESQNHVWLIGLIATAVAAALGFYTAAACLATAAVGASLSIERGIGMFKGKLGKFLGLQIGVQLWVLFACVALFVFHVDGPGWWIVVYAAPFPIVLGLTLKFRTFAYSPLSWRRNFRSVSGTSVRYMLGGFGSLMASRVERLLLPVLASTEALGLYVAVATASEMLIWAARGLGESRVLGFMNGSLSRGKLARVAARDFGYFLLLAIPLALGMKFLLLPLLGASFDRSSSLIIPLCLASAAWACYLQVSSAWLARGSVRQSMQLDVGAAALTTISVSILIPLYGALGAAFGCLIAYTIMVFVAVALLPLVDRIEVPDE